MKENLKILYLQGFHVFGEKRQQKLLENAMGKENIIVPNIKYRRDIIAFFSFIFFIIAIMIFNTGVALKFAGTLIVVVTIILSVIIAFAMYFIGSHLILYYIMKKAIKQAEYKLLTHDPDVVVGSYFGAIVAMNLKYKSVIKPLVLISPSINKFQKFTQNAEPDLSMVPYVIIVNGSKDKVNLMSTCEKLAATIPMDRGRLEIVDDNHTYSKLTEADFKGWIKEANYNATKGLQYLTNKLRNEKFGKKFGIHTKTLTVSQSAEFINDNNMKEGEEEPLV